jgi:[acyl-carrier-protein] S-malonyltransferase
MLAAERKLKAIVLNVSAPFHCALMAPAAERMKSALVGTRIGPLSFAVLPNVEARPNSEPGRVAELLVKQVDSPVLWEQTVAAMAESGVTRALEIGPGKVLAGLVKRIDKRISVLSVGDAEGLAKVSDFLSA